MFCLHGNGRDQTGPHRNRTVQEAHRLQEEETAAFNKETTLSASSSDTTQGQLSDSTP